MSRSRKKLSEEVIETVAAGQASAEAAHLVDKSTYHNILDEDEERADNDTYLAMQSLFDSYDYEDGCIEALSLALDAEN